MRCRRFPTTIVYDTNATIYIAAVDTHLARSSESEPEQPSSESLARRMYPATCQKNTQTSTAGLDDKKKKLSHGYQKGEKQYKITTYERLVYRAGGLSDQPRQKLLRRVFSSAQSPQLRQSMHALHKNTHDPSNIYIATCTSPYTVGIIA